MGCIISHNTPISIHNVDSFIERNKKLAYNRQFHFIGDIGVCLLLYFGKTNNECIKKNSKCLMNWCMHMVMQHMENT